MGLFAKTCLFPVLAFAGWALAGAPGGSLAAETVVRKVAEPFDEAPWPLDPWNKAGGLSASSSDVQADAKSPKSMALEVRFSGKGFEWFAAAPTETLWIPGDAKSVSLRCKADAKGYPLILRFVDGWGRREVGKAKLEWTIPTEPEGQWRTSSFKVPPDWVRPVGIAGISSHNWSAQSDAKTVRFWVDDIEIETDTAGVDPATGLLKTWKPEPQPKDPNKAYARPPKTPLVAVEVFTGVESNVFSREEPAVNLRVRNWKEGTLTGKLSCRTLDSAGAETDRQDRDVSVENIAAMRVPLKVARFGLYTLETMLALSDGSSRTDKATVARLPPYRELSDAQMVASPYGLNVHGAGEKSRISPFRKAGVVWFREYAFAYDWLLKAKGTDKSYGGWPWYPKIVQRYLEARVKVLPCLQKSVRAPEVKDGKAVGQIGPDNEWMREITDIVNAFPKFSHWELSNEYDLDGKHAAAESLIGWANYRAYHRKFAEILSLLGGGDLKAVEQGRAGIWPDRVRKCVESGDFDKVFAVNSHHYCGVDAPEANFGNFNTGFDGKDDMQKPMLLFDRLREVRRAGCSDGKKRESWLTEFGWDTLAGNVVTPHQQAVYLARGWMLAMAAGTDKCFWFYDFDAAAPKQFFDGCGLLAHDASPKLSLCALAGLTSVLPNPRFVGSISAGEGTCGFVFESDGQLVASLWTIQGDDGPKVSFRAKQLYDWLGNKMDGNSAALRMAPVYAAGLDKADTWYRQTAYGLSTPYLVVATAGDPVTPALSIENNRDEALVCRVRMALPQGWTAENPDARADVSKGGTKDIPMPFTVAAAEPLGEKTVGFTVFEGAGQETPLKEMLLRVLVQPPLVMRVGPVEGRPGKTTVTVKVGNMSARPVDGTLRLRLPAAWKAAAADTKIEGLRPQEIRDVRCEFEWSLDWKAGESACAEFDAGAGKLVSRPIIPNCIRIRRAKGLTMDGNLDDWPADTAIPGWMLGSSLGDANAKIRLAWAVEGLYFAVEVADSTLSTADPRSFWNGDCMEVFLDAGDDKRHRFFEPGDHQFWFVPLAGEKRVYAGQWKRQNEIPETRYDVPGLRSVAAAKGDGYAMEFLLPAERIQKFAPAIGRRLGLNLNLTVKGRRLAREVFWPRTKADWIVQNLPKTWGSVELAE